MIYLGQPYSHPDPEVREERYTEAFRLCARLARTGHFVYSPIVHWHFIAYLENLPTEYAFWRPMNLHFLRRSELLMVYCLEGWKESVGLNDEIDFATQHRIPINYFMRLSDAQSYFEPVTYTRDPRLPPKGRN